MALPTSKTRMAAVILLGCLCAPVVAAQTAGPALPPGQSGPQPADHPKSAAHPAVAVPSQAAGSHLRGPDDRPLPDVVAMMRDVEANERKSEALEKDYLYHSVVTEQKVDAHGQVKKTEVTEYDHYWLNGVPVARMLMKDGKPLSQDELSKEDKRIDKESAKARERREDADAQGKQTGPRGEDEITVSRLLELGTFTNPRRVQLNGRDTIAIDFAGNPQAKTRNRSEEVIRDMLGTAWIDEQDRVLARVEGHFVNPFKVGGGLVMNIQKDTRFAFEQTKVNDEVWLPARIEGQGAARVLLFFNFNGSLRAVESDYRKFRTSSTILPGMTQTSPPQEQQPPAGNSKPH